MYEHAMRSLALAASMLVLGGCILLEPPATAFFGQAGEAEVRCRKALELGDIDAAYAEAVVAKRAMEKSQSIGPEGIRGVTSVAYWKALQVSMADYIEKHQLPLSRAGERHPQSWKGLLEVVNRMDLLAVKPAPESQSEQGAETGAEVAEVAVPIQSRDVIWFKSSGDIGPEDLRQLSALTQAAMAANMPGRKYEFRLDEPAALAPKTMALELEVTEQYVNYQNTGSAPGRVAMVGLDRRVVHGTFREGLPPFTVEFVNTASDGFSGTHAYGNAVDRLRADMKLANEALAPQIASELKRRLEVRPGKARGKAR
jgi:hypothetical protein